jgi:hypothetical protein
MVVRRNPARPGVPIRRNRRLEFLNLRHGNRRGGAGHPETWPNSDSVGVSAWGVRRKKAALSSGCKSHPANAPAGSNRSSHGGNEMAEAFG